MIIAQEFVQEINGFVRDVPLVLRRYEPRPRPLGVALLGRTSEIEKTDEARGLTFQGDRHIEHRGVYRTFRGTGRAPLSPKLW